MPHLNALTLRQFLIPVLFLILSIPAWSQSTPGDSTLHGLPDSAKTLKQVSVYGKSTQTTASKTVLRLSNSITASGTDAWQAMGQLPGITLNGTEIRAAGRGTVKVLLNNRLIPLQGEPLMRYLRSFAANEIDRIEWISQPSAAYDADGGGGLINIITRHSRLQGLSGNLQATGKWYLPGQSEVYGVHTFGEWGGTANLAYNKDKLSAWGSFNYVQDRHLEGFGTDLYYPKQSWLQTDTGLYIHRSFNILAGLDYQLSNKTTVGGSWSGGRNLYDGADHVNNPIYGRNGKPDSVLRTFATYYPVALPNAVNLHADIRLDTAGRQLHVNADYFDYYRTDRSDFESNSIDRLGKPGDPTRYFDRNKQDIKIYTFKTDLELPTSFARYAFGVKLSFIDNYSNAFYYRKLADSLQYDNNLSNEFGYRENTQAFYGSMSKESGPWKGQLGFRTEITQTRGHSFTTGETHNNDYVRLFPSLQISYHAAEYHDFTLSIGRRINRPSFWNLNPFKSLYTAYSYGEGNPALRPEYTTTATLSHNYRGLLTSSVFFNLSTDGFTNLTMAAADTNLVYTVPLNFLRTTRIGLTENLSWTPAVWWENDEQITVYYTDARSDLPVVQNITGAGAYLASNNTFYFNQSRSFAGALNFWCQFPEVDHASRSNTYYKLDLGFRYIAPGHKWDLALNLNDAFGSSASSLATTVNNIPQRFTNFQFGRYVQLSWNYPFGRVSGRSGSRGTGNEEERGRVH